VTAKTLLRIKDPAERARRAIAAEITYRDEMTAIRTVRDEAIAELRAQDWGYDRLARALGITKARVAQLVKKDQSGH
jgi:hypothetical protein